MEKFKLALSVLLLSAFLVAAGCSNGGAGVTAASETRQTPGITAATPEQETQAPVATAAAETPAAAAEQTAASIETIPDELLNLNYADAEKYNEFFSEKTSVDLDGDGKEETIKLNPLKTESDGYGKSITISAAGKELQISAENGWHIYDEFSSPYGTVLDIDKNDGRKEIMIGEQRDDYSPNEISDRVVVIIYADGNFKTAGGWRMPIEANGTGYVTYTKYSKELKGGYSIGLQGVLRYSPEKGLEEMNLEKYTAQSYTGSSEYTLETVADQTVAGKPGGEKDKLVKEGSKIFFGQYDPLGWIEVYNAGGKKIGWLDLNEVDIDKYTGYAIEASCH